MWIIRSSIDFRMSVFEMASRFLTVCVFLARSHISSAKQGNLILKVKKDGCLTGSACLINSVFKKFAKNLQKVNKCKRLDSKTN